MVYTQFTDADLFDEEVVSGHSLAATTLDFSSLDTANLSTKSLFFSVGGLVPTGFQVESVRVRKDGSEPFTLSLTTQQTGGNAELCQALQVKVFKDWTQIFAGSLLSLALNEEINTSEAYQDLVFVVGLDQATGSIMNSNCSFAFTFSTLQTESTRFSDTEVLTNTVATGSWTQ